MFVILFILWILFNGRLTWEVAAFGVVISGAVYGFCCAFLGYSPKKEWQLIRRTPQVAKYLWLLLQEIVKANLALVETVYHRSQEVKPKLVTFPTPLKGAAKSVLADCITLTPGTITVESEGDRLTVHALDDSFAQGIEDTEFQKQLIAMHKEEQSC